MADTHGSAVNASMTALTHAVVAGAATPAAIAALRAIRDWPARHRLNHAIVADIENKLLARRVLREALVHQSIRSAGMPPTRQGDQSVFDSPPE